MRDAQQPSLPARQLIIVGAPRSGASLLARELRRASGWGASVRSDTDAPEDLEVVVDWVPPWSLQIGQLAAAAPTSRFIFMARQPVPTISSLMFAWASRRFVSQPDLPDWWGDPWSFPLIDRWRELIGAPRARIAAVQWATITEAALDELQQIPPERWTVAVFERLLDEPANEIDRLTRGLELDWEAEIPLPLAPTATVVTPPNSSAWHRNLDEIGAVVAEVATTSARLEHLVAEHLDGYAWPPLAAPQPTRPIRTVRPSAGTAFASAHSSSMVELLATTGRSLIASTYNAGQLIIARADTSSETPRLNTEFIRSTRPMGLAVAGNRLAVGTEDTIESFTANRRLGTQIDSPHPIDAVYTPRSVTHTGDIAIHDMAIGADGTLYFVNTKFSCLCRQDLDHSFVPIWQPPWITGLANEDRCHLNGLCLVDGAPAYVTALAPTNTANGWREHKGTAGLIMDMRTETIIAEGLAMPHSPRWHDGQLWFLESGTGALATVDTISGQVTHIAELPGFTRGLTFVGPYALVGLSQVRETVFSALPITSKARERNCGVWMVDVRNGDIVGLLRFDGAVQELFEVQTLPYAWPTLIDAGPMTRNSFVLPEEALAQIDHPRPS